MRALKPFLMGVLALVSGCVIDIHSASLCDEASDCGSEDYCDFPLGWNSTCGGLGHEGFCMPKPEECTSLDAPVCGCDGRTYGNSCLAHREGVDVARNGSCTDACLPMDAHAGGGCDFVLGWYWDGTSCSDLTGCWCVGDDCLHGFGSEAACEDAHSSCERLTCTANASCGTGSWCDFPDASMCGENGYTGVCRDIPSACPPVIAPVCGCDDNTYSSACDANVAGVDVAYSGDCVSARICGGLAGFACNADEWCDYPADSSCGAADQIGTCEARPESCSLIYSPVCACDGTTYSNECLANAAGVDVVHSGSCDAHVQCQAGVAACATNEWCDVADGESCGAIGVCRSRPALCPEYYSATCGCDGVTYSSPCHAESAGVDVAYPGECASPADCRSLGCEGDAACHACLTPGGAAWVCIPSGAEC